MKRSWTYYARYAVAGLLLYLVFGWARERMTECPVGQRITTDSDGTSRCMCNDPALTLVDGLCKPPPTLDPMDPTTWSTERS
jgi:hypothetical protein